MSRRNPRQRPLALLVALLTALALTVAGAGVTSASAAPTVPGSTHTVANTGAGKIVSHIYGSTANGRSVTGNFVPLKFITKGGKLKARGLVNGVVHNADGSTRSFTALRTIRVKSINGTSTSGKPLASAKAATCDVLHLNLAPLDLDLLGLQVHLDRVVLDIVAKSGAGNLLGNLLCAVAGLLDGGPLAGLLGQLQTLLNQILGLLNLGL